jgi:hypothetical protein
LGGRGKVSKRVRWTVGREGEDGERNILGGRRREGRREEERWRIKREGEKEIKEESKREIERREEGKGKEEYFGRERKR